MLYVDDVIGHFGTEDVEHYLSVVSLQRAESPICHYSNTTSARNSHALKHNNIVGGWLNSENGYYYFDSVKIFEDSKLDEAIKFAKYFFINE